MIRTLDDLRGLPAKATIWPRGFAFPITRTAPGEPAGLEWHAPGEAIGHTEHEIPLPASLIYNPWAVIERHDLVMPASGEVDPGSAGGSE